jgi:hypothetical protein
VWARSRIAELSRKQIRGETPETRQEIVGLALAHSLMTRYTAFVAVDSAYVTKGGESTKVTVPVEVPQGLRANRRPAAMGGGSYGFAGSYAMKAPVAKPKYYSEDFDGGFLGPATDPLPDRALKSARRPDERARESYAEGAPVLAARGKRGLQRCVEKRRKAKPDLEGSVKLRVVVGKDGKVIKVIVTGADDAELDACVRGVARGWKFERRREEAEINVVLQMQ